ncbi:hypothetical protein PM082_011446 [Marasmius tenuissimus]|nr:hypothetical protein PM082_011446 [Marasmius tenuissimus]
MVEPHNLTIFDNSPTFLYQPSREGEDLNAGWKGFYSDSQDSAYNLDPESASKANGASSHNTTMNGASFELSFKGTAVLLYGSGTAGAYSTTLDDRDVVNGNPSNGLLASYRKLDYKIHTLSLNLTQGRLLSILSAVVTVGIGKTGASITDFNVSAVNVNDGTLSSSSFAAFSTSVGGTFNTNHDTTGYSRVDTNNSDSSIIFQFNNASALRVYGSINHDHGTYSATLSPSGGASTGTRILNGTSKWFAYDSLIYWESDLDRSQSYTLTLTNLEQGKYLDVHSVNLFYEQGGSDSSDGHHLSTGAIVGIATGIGALIVLVGILLLWRRRRRNRNDLDSATPAIYSGPYELSGLPPHSQPLLEAYVEPFNFPPSITQHNNERGSKSHSRMHSSNSSTSYGTHSVSSPWPDAELLSLNNSQLPPGAGTSGKGTQPSPTPSRTVRQETDAGPVPIATSLEEEVLPPGYNPMWSAGQS